MTRGEDAHAGPRGRHLGHHHRQGGRQGIAGLIVLVALLAVVALWRLVIYRGVDGFVVGWPDGVILNLRLTACVTALLVGGALGLAGVFMQSFLRNPLASPSLLGVSAGAALGVMFVMYLDARGGRDVTGGAGMLISLQTVAALVGAAAVLGCVVLLSRGRGWVDPLSVLLTGVVISTMAGAIIVFLQAQVPEGVHRDFFTWSAGYIRETTPQAALWVTAGIVVVSAALAIVYARTLDALSFDTSTARSIGVHIGPARLALLGVAGLLTAIAVSLAGPIGFVGLVAPHMARWLVGSAHRILIPGSLVAGAAVLVAGDAAAQTVRVAGGRLPVGVFTAVLGGATFLVLLIRMRRGGVRV